MIAYQRSQEFYIKQRDLTQSNREAAQLANVRYEGGVTSYLEVLYNEQQLFDSELILAQARRDEFLSVIQLYRALGVAGRRLCRSRNNSAAVSRQP